MHPFGSTDSHSSSPRVGELETKIATLQKQLDDKERSGADTILEQHPSQVEEGGGDDVDEEAGPVA